MPLAIAARSPDRKPAVTGPIMRGHGPTAVLPHQAIFQLPVSALSPADLLYLQRCAGNEAVCALMNRCPGDETPTVRSSNAGVELQRKPAAAPANPKAKAKAPPFPFAPSCDLKIPVEGSAPGLEATAEKADEDIEWIDGVTAGEPPLPDQIDLSFQASSEEKASKAVRAQWEKKIVACETAEKARLTKVSATGVGTPTHDANVKTAETASEAKIVELRKNLEELVASTEAKYESGRDNNRRVFMETMRCYLGSDAATKDHFQSLEQVTEFPGGPWLYKDAAEAIRGVAKDMGGKDKLPKADNAQNLRARHLHFKEQQGHPMGFSIDYYPSDNPMISEAQRVALLELITGKTSHVETGMDFGARRKRIEQIAAGKDKDVEAFFNNFDVAFEKTKKASEAVRLTPGSDEMKALDKAKDNYVKSQTELPKAQQNLAAIEQQIATLSKAGGDPKQRQALEEQRATAAKTKQELEAARDAIPGLLATAFAPWLKQIKTRITEIEKIGAEAKAAGVVIEKLPSKGSLDSAASTLAKMAALEQKISDAEAKAKEPAPAPAPGAKGSKAKPKKAPAPPLDAWRKQDKKWREAVTPILASMDEAMRAQAAKKDRTITDRLAQIATLRPWVDDPTKKSDWLGLPTLRQLQTSLTQDTGFVFGSVRMANAIGKGSGDAKDVPIYQLAKKGFFNPTDTYSLAFFKTMMKHGFDPGVTWGPGWTDAMHFDYVPSFHQIVAYACGPSKKKKK